MMYIQRRMMDRQGPMMDQSETSMYHEVVQQDCSNNKISKGVRPNEQTCWISHVKNCNINQKL